MSIVGDLSGLVEIESVAGTLLEKFPELRTYDNLGEMVSSAVNQAYRLREQANRLPQHRWLFEVAGRLKTLTQPYLRNSAEEGSRLSPIALTFAAAAVRVGIAQGAKGRGQYIDWLDDDAVMLEFEDAWVGRTFTKASLILDKAVEVGARNPLRLNGNRYFVWVVNIAHELFVQHNQGDFILPISEKLAKLMGTSRATVGSAVLKAEREGWIIKRKEAQHSRRLARTFVLNEQKLQSHLDSLSGEYDPFAHG